MFAFSGWFATAWKDITKTTKDITKDIFVGDGSTFTFTLSKTPTDEKNIIVYVDGVMQEPDENYTLSGTTFSFTPPDDSSLEAPHAGARIVVMHGFAEEPVA